MQQEDIPKKEDEVMSACRMTIAMILFVNDPGLRPDRVVIDEGPRDEIEMCRDLKQGRIQYPRTTPLADRLKHVWYIKGHHPQHIETSVELLIAEYKWNPGYLVLALRWNGDWEWVGG